MILDIVGKITEALIIWNKYAGNSLSTTEAVQLSIQISKNIENRPNRCHFQITTGFRDNDSRKWFIHSKLHSFVNKDRTEIAFWAEPNVNDEPIKNKVLITCKNIMDRWRVVGLIVATDIPDLIDEWQKGSDGPHYCFNKEDE